MSAKQNTFAVIMAGGSGTRFWPLSRKLLPKQFLHLNGSEQSLIQATATRILPLIENSNLCVVATDDQGDLVKAHLPNCKFISEPLSRNTTAAIGLAALELLRKSPDAIMLVLPADHVVKNDIALRQLLEQAINLAANNDILVTLGIKPDSANTAYGYISQGESFDQNNAFRVNRFFEKPNQKRAEEYLASGKFFWNSGIFVWKASEILKSIKLYAPDIYDLLVIAETKRFAGQSHDCTEIYQSIESISIDFSVLEHARNVVMLQANDLDWSDIGSWDSWGQFFNADSSGNVAIGDVLLIDSKNCIVRGSKRLIAIVGAQDLVVIDEEDACLICPKARVQDVKLIVDDLKKKGRTNLI